MTQELTLTDHCNYVTAINKPADLINRDISTDDSGINGGWKSSVAKWRKSLLMA